MKIILIPVFLRHCDFKESIFGVRGVQGLPSDAKWIVSSKYPHRDEAYLEVVNGIKEILDE